MRGDRGQEEVRAAVEPVLVGMGFAVVELSIGRVKGSSRVHVVLYRASGVGVEDCAEASRVLFPLLQTLEGLPDVSLEVSSPGIDREIKSPAEYRIFVGRGVRILVGDSIEWFGGIIDRVEDDTVWLRKGIETRGVPVAAIRRARLDHSVEVEETKNAV